MDEMKDDRNDLQIRKDEVLWENSIDVPNFLHDFIFPYSCYIHNKGVAARGRQQMDFVINYIF